MGLLTQNMKPNIPNKKLLVYKILFHKNYCLYYYYYYYYYCYIYIYNYQNDTKILCFKKSQGTTHFGKFGI
jgi:hypothetical protein